MTRVEDPAVWTPSGQVGTEPAPRPTAALGPAPDLSIPGLGTLRAALDRAVAELELKTLTVVIDDPDLGRQAFRAGAQPLQGEALPGAVGVRADPPFATKRLDADLLLALAAASLRVDVLRGDVTGAYAPEIAIRQIPGVHAVVMDEEDGLLIVEVHVGPDAGPDISRAAARAAAPLGGGSVVIEIVRSAAPATTPTSAFADDTATGDPNTPSVVAVRTVTSTSEIEVHVRRADVRTIGRAQMSAGLAGAVDATLDALRQLDSRFDLTLAWARTIETTADRRFVVAVALHHLGTREARHGLGSGNSPIEGAARGALDAAIRTDDASLR